VRVACSDQHVEYRDDAAGELLAVGSQRDCSCGLVRKSVVPTAVSSWRIWLAKPSATQNRGTALSRPGVLRMTN
jgi:hypothetical protein